MNEILLQQQLSRTNVLLGDNGVKQLRESIVGLINLQSGVGGATAVHLLRSAVGTVLVKSSSLRNESLDTERVVVEQLASDVSLNIDDVIEQRSRPASIAERAREIVANNVRIVECNSIDDMLHHKHGTPRAVAFCHVNDDVVDGGEGERFASAVEKFVNAGVYCLVVADCRGALDATRLRVSSPGDATIDDWSARSIRRMLLRRNIRSHVGIVHTNSTTRPSASIDTMSVAVVGSLGAIVASHLIGCVTDAFEQEWRSPSLGNTKKLAKQYGDAIRHFRKRRRKSNTSEEDDDNPDNNDNAADDNDGEKDRAKRDINKTSTSSTSSNDNNNNNNKKDANNETVPTPETIEYVIDCMWQNRSAMSRRAGASVLEPWDPSLPLVPSNLIALLEDEASLFVEKGQALFDKHRREFVESVLRKELKL